MEVWTCKTVVNGLRKSPTVAYHIRSKALTKWRFDVVHRTITWSNDLRWRCLRRVGPDHGRDYFMLRHKELGAKPDCFCTTTCNHTMHFLHLVWWKLYRKVDQKMRYCGMGQMIPRLKFHRFCCLRISEISQICNTSNNGFTVKPAPPAKICSGTFTEHCFSIYKHVLTLAGHISKTDVTVLKKKCFSSAARLCGHPTLQIIHRTNISR